jgi:hypothetical protein
MVTNTPTSASRPPDKPEHEVKEAKAKSAAPRGGAEPPIGSCRWNMGVLEQYVSIDDTRHDWHPVPSTGDAQSITLTELVPSEATFGPSAEDLEVALKGTGFVEGATVIFDGVAKSTEFVSDTELKTTIMPSTVKEAKQVQVTVKVNAKETEPPIVFTFKEPAVEPMKRSPLADAKSVPPKAEAKESNKNSHKEAKEYAD